MKKNKKIYLKTIITVIVLIIIYSIIRMNIDKNLNKEKIVKEQDEFVIGEMNYKIPSGFKYNLKNDTNYKSYNYSKDYVSCYIVTEMYNDKNNMYKTGKEYLNKNIYITLNDKVETYDNEDWYTVNIKESDNTTKIISSIKKNNNIYIIKYRNSDYSNGESSETKEYKKCASAYEYVFKSIGIKK